MNYQLASLSTDLRRISNWIYAGNNDLAKNYAAVIENKYKNIKSVGIYKNVWQEIKIITDLKDGRERSADRATTLGSILLQESLKD